MATPTEVDFSNEQANWLLQRHEALAIEVARWIREWDAFAGNAVGLSGLKLTVDSIEARARDLIPTQIADEARWAAECKTDQAAKAKAPASSAVPSPASPGGPAPIAPATPHSS